MSAKPKHLGIIMDGNRRWARRRGLPIHRGHSAGVLALEELVRACQKRGIFYVTAYGFSTENWGRSKLEVKWLIKIIEEAFRKFVDLLDKEGWRVKFIGRIKDFPKTTQSLMAKAEHQLKDNNKGLLTLALSYGGRDEIVRAVEKIRSFKGKITERDFSKFLDTYDLSDPDLIIRTGGVMRLSNFLPWQSVYSELYFTPTLWPAFTAKHLDRALKVYAQRQRNFGK